MDNVTMKSFILTAMAHAKESMKELNMIMSKLIRPGFVTTPVRAGQHLVMKNVIIQIGNLVAMENVKILLMRKCFCVMKSVRV